MNLWRHTGTYNVHVVIKLHVHVRMYLSQACIVYTYMYVRIFSVFAYNQGTHVGML